MQTFTYAITKSLKWACYRVFITWWLFVAVKRHLSTCKTNRLSTGVKLKLTPRCIWPPAVCVVLSLRAATRFFGDDFGVDHFSSLKDKELQYELYILLYRMCAMSWMLSMPMLLTAAVIYFCIAAFKLPIMPLFRLPNRTNLFLLTSNDIVSISVFRSFSYFPCSVPPRQHSGVLVTLLPHSMKALGSIPWWKRAFQCRVPRMCGFPLGALVSPKIKNTFHTTHLFCLLWIQWPNFYIAVRDIFIGSYFYTI